MGEKCKFCESGELKLHEKSHYGLFKYLICDNCFMTYDYEMNQWLKSDRTIISLSTQNSPIFK